MMKNYLVYCLLIVFSSSCTATLKFSATQKQDVPFIIYLEGKPVGLLYDTLYLYNVKKFRSIKELRAESNAQKALRARLILQYTKIGKQLGLDTYIPKEVRLGRLLRIEKAGYLPVEGALMRLAFKKNNTINPILTKIPPKVIGESISIKFDLRNFSNWQIGKSLDISEATLEDLIIERLEDLDFNIVSGRFEKEKPKYILECEVKEFVNDEYFNMDWLLVDVEKEEIVFESGRQDIINPNLKNKSPNFDYLID